MAAPTGHHERVRRRAVLPGQPGHPRPDGQLPGARIQPAGITRRCVRRRRRLGPRGGYQPAGGVRHHQRLRAGSLLPACARLARPDGKLPRPGAGPPGRRARLLRRRCRLVPPGRCQPSRGQRHHRRLRRPPLLPPFERDTWPDGGLPASGPDARRDVRLSVVPGVERLEPAHRSPAGGRKLGDPHRHDRGERGPASGLRRVPRLRDPGQRGRLGHATLIGDLRLRRRVRRGAVPDSRRSQDRGRQRSAPADVGRRRVHALRAVRRAPHAIGLARRLWRDLGPGLECAAAGRLDQCRCRRAADPAWPGALRRGRRGRDRARHSLHRPRHSFAPTSTPPVTMRAPAARARSRRWACGSG